LNRVSFLRPDHAFLSQALKHPSTTFLLFNKLDPLIKSGSELAYAKFNEVQPIIGSDPFEKTEADVIKEYNSSTYVPQIVFLGLDERKEGFQYKEHYKGQPYFAVDVTPKESVAAAAEALIKDVEAKGLSFSKERMHLSLPAQEGSSTIARSALLLQLLTHH
jgi:NAD+ diphosphatase